MKRLVVIGASYGGLWSVEQISKLNLELEIVLISPASHFFFNLSSPRVLIEIEKLDKLFFPVEKVLKSRCKGEVEFIQAKVTDVDMDRQTIRYVGERSRREREQKHQDLGSDRDESKLEDLLDISYDYLIISSGTRGNISGFQANDVSHQDSIDCLNHLHSQLQWLQNIAVIGGGPTGVEVATEIKGTYPDKVVTIYGSKPAIVHSMGEDFSNRLMVKLEALGVKVVNNKKFQDYCSSDKEVRFQDGDSALADLTITTNSVPNSEFLRKYPDCLDEKNHIMTDNYLNVLTYQNVWVIGDVLAGGAKNVGGIYHYQVPYLKDSLKKHMNGKRADRPIPSYQTAMTLPVHKTGGVGKYGKWNIPSWLVYWFKGRDYYLGHAQKFFG